LRAEFHLEGPRVARIGHLPGCDEWNHISDEWRARFCNYPLASKNECGTIGSGWPQGALPQIVL